MASLWIEALYSPTSALKKRLKSDDHGAGSVARLWIFGFLLAGFIVSKSPIHDFGAKVFIITFFAIAFSVVFIFLAFPLAWIINWLGREAFASDGGALEIRAAFADSVIPMVLCSPFVIASLVLPSFGFDKAWLDMLTSSLIQASGIWSFLIFAANLTVIQHLTWWQAILLTLISTILLMVFGNTVWLIFSNIIA